MLATLMFLKWAAGVEITDDYADVIGSYDRLHIMPLFQAEGDRDLQHKIVSEIYATAGSLFAVHRKCQIN